MPSYVQAENIKIEDVDFKPPTSAKAPDGSTYYRCSTKYSINGKESDLKIQLPWVKIVKFKIKEDGKGGSALCVFNITPPKRFAG